MTAARWVEPDPDDQASWDALLPIPERTLDDDGLPWFRPPAWLDPTRTLRHNRPWQTP